MLKLNRPSDCSSSGLNVSWLTWIWPSSTHALTKEVLPVFATTRNFECQTPDMPSRQYGSCQVCTQNCKTDLALSCQSVLLSIWLWLLSSHWMDFHEIWYSTIFWKSIMTMEVSLKSDKINRYFAEDLCVFMIISQWILLRMRNVSDKICRKNQNTHFMFNKLFTKNCAFMR
jgi:hypothetical protein